MPIIKQTFKVDLFQLKNSRDVESLLKSIKDGHARDLGLAIIEDFPYEKVVEDSYEGELPAAVLTKDHHFTETWEAYFCLLTAAQWEMVKAIMRRSISDQEIKNLEG